VEAALPANNPTRQLAGLKTTSRQFDGEKACSFSAVQNDAIDVVDGARSLQRGALG